MTKVKLFFRGERCPEYIERITPHDVHAEFRPLVTLAVRSGGEWHLYPYFMDQSYCILRLINCKGKNVHMDGGPTVFHGGTRGMVRS